MVYSYRQRMERLATEDFAGDPLSAELSSACEIRISAVLEMALKDVDYSVLETAGHVVRVRAGRRIEILENYTSVREALDALTGVDLLDAVEAFFVVPPQYSKLQMDAASYAKLISDILREERAAVDFINQQFVPVRTRELHEEVIRPALTLLGGKPGWEAVEATYRKALNESDPGDAITDVGTALQETLELLGFKGSSLGLLISDAKKQGWILGHDAKLLESITNWVSADRSTVGDAHHASAATDVDAWLTIHVVGALILRLSDGVRPQRQPSSA